MDTQLLTDKQLIALILGEKTAEKLYSGRLLPLMCGEGGSDPHPRLSASLELTKRALQEQLKRSDCLTSSQLTRQYLKAHFLGQPYESFVVLFLDNQHRVIEVRELFKGTIDGSMVHPREVVRECLRWNAAAVIFAHNHPSGVSEPSQADTTITRRLKNSLALVDVRTLDHLVVGSDSVTSLAERGLI